MRVTDGSKEAASLLISQDPNLARPPLVGEMQSVLAVILHRAHCLAINAEKECTRNDSRQGSSMGGTEVRHDAQESVADGGSYDFDQGSKCLQEKQMTVNTSGAPRTMMGRKRMHKGNWRYPV